MVRLGVLLWAVAGDCASRDFVLDGDLYARVASFHSLALRFASAFSLSWHGDAGAVGKKNEGIMSL